MDYYLGEIRMWTCPRIPDGWVVCDGRALQISTYEALYSLIGTAWGGNGVSTFCVPNLSGRVPVGQGQGAGLTSRTLGTLGGSECVALTVSSIPAHVHGFGAATAAATTSTPSPSTVWASGTGQDVWYVTPGTTPYSKNIMESDVIIAEGGNVQHMNTMQALAVNFIISTNGIYPTHP